MNDPFDHDKAIDLLPWFINGTLSGHERDLVERHVRDCLPCRAALREQQRLAAIVKTQPTVRLSPEQGFEQLMTRVDQSRTDYGNAASKHVATSDNVVASERRALHERIVRGDWSLRPVVPHWLGSAARHRAGLAAAMLGAFVAVVVVFWVALGPSQDPLDDSFVTLTDGSASRTTASDGARLDIVFADSVTEADMRALVRALGGTIVGGPSDVGRYTVLLDSTTTRSAEIDALIAELRRDPRIQFVGRALNSSTSQ